MDLELGQAKHGWQNSNALTEPHLEFTAKLKAGTDPVSKGTDLTFPSYPRCLAEPVGMDELESLLRDKRDKHACMTEYRAELERLMSSIDARLEQSSAHHQTGRRILYQVQLLSILHLLFMVAMYLAYYFGFIVDIRPWSWSIARCILVAETALFTFLVLLRMWEHYEHDQRRSRLDEFSSKFDFERMPALKERCGEQKWKEMQECSDVFLVLEKFEAIFSSACDDINPKFQISGVKNVGNLTVGCP